jgi:hypothetical protein
MDFEEYVVDLNADCKCGCMFGDRYHKIFHFPNDYGASVVGLPKKQGVDERGFRILIIKFIDEMEYRVITEPLFDAGFLECTCWEQTAERLKKIKEL